MRDLLDIETKARGLNAALEKHLGVKGRSLHHSVRRAGRRLPKRLRTQAELMAKADTVRGNIKLARQFDPTEVKRAFTDVSRHLSTIDRRETRKTWILSVLAVLAFNFILVFTAVVLFLRMRGTI